jgi:hypothetical protein
MCVIAPTPSAVVTTLLCKNALRLREGRMGLATLNVWGHDKQDPCKISDAFWFVGATYCNGNPVEWCGHTYGAERSAATQSFNCRRGAMLSAPFNGYWSSLSPCSISAITPWSLSTVTRLRVSIFTLPPVGSGPMAPRWRCSFLQNPKSFRRTRLKSFWLRAKPSRKTCRRPPSAVLTIG